MFRLATVPTLSLRTRLAPTAKAATTALSTHRKRRAASADLRIRRFESGSVSEDSYTAIVPSSGATPAELLRIISDACKDMPEFQIQGEEDEQFIVTLTLKG